MKHVFFLKPLAPSIFNISVYELRNDPQIVHFKIWESPTICQNIHPILVFEMCKFYSSITV